MTRINYTAAFAAALDRVKQEGRYRVFNTLERRTGDFSVARHHDKDKDIIIWCANDYLGMGQHPEVISAMEQTINRMGAGAGGTRNISGTHCAVVELVGLAPHKAK